MRFAPLKYLLRFLLGILALLILYGLSGVILSVLPTRPEVVSCEEKQEIYIASNGVHLNLIIPTEIMPRDLLQELSIPERAEFVSFGWGDKRFYLETPTWGQLKPETTLRAIFLKTESALHVEHYQGRSSNWHPQPLCPTQCGRLIDFVVDTFARDETGQIRRIDAPGYGQNDAFYEARGHYSFIRTCNNWVNIGLKRAHVKTSIWSPFDFGVLYHLK